MSQQHKSQRRKTIIYFFIALAGWLLDAIGFSVPINSIVNNIFMIGGTIIALVFGILFIRTLF